MKFKCFLNTIGWLATFLFLLADVLLPLASSETVARSDKTAIKDDDEEWNTSDDGLIQWQDDCEFGYDYFVYSELIESKTFEECGNQCLNRPTKCNHFNYRKSECLLLWKTKLTKTTGEDDWSEGSTCGFISRQIWQKSNEDDRIAIKSNCAFPSSADGQEVNLLKSFDSCQRVCTEDHRCSAFSYNAIDGKCVLPHRANKVEKISGPLNLNYLFLLRSPIISSSANASCAVVVTRVWQADGDGIYHKDNCEFKGFDIEEPQKLNSSVECEDQCTDNVSCTHFTYYENNGTCHVKNAPLLTDRVETEGVECGYIPDPTLVTNRWNKTTRIDNSFFLWRENCEIELTIIGNISNISAENCTEECVATPECNFFSHDGTDCHLMFELDLKFHLIINEKEGWTCGVVATRIWDRSSSDQRVLQRPNCEFPSPVDDSGVSNETSLDSCENICLSDLRCNAFSYDGDFKGGKCFLPHKATAQSWSLSSFTQLFRLSSPLDLIAWSSHCGFIPTRNWKVNRISESGDGLLYQDDCDFNKGFDIEKPTEQKSFNDCITHCFNMTKCTHFSYSSSNRICNVKNAPALTDREAVGISDKMCGYIPSRLQSKEDDTNPKLWIYVVPVVIILFILLASSLFVLIKYIVRIVFCYQYINDKISIINKLITEMAESL